MKHEIDISEAGRLICKNCSGSWDPYDEMVHSEECPNDILGETMVVCPDCKGSGLGGLCGLCEGAGRVPEELAAGVLSSRFPADKPNVSARPKIEMPRVGDPPEKIIAYRLQEQAAASKRFRETEIPWKIEALKAWQATGHVHPLTCGGCDERKNLLEPQQKGEMVALVCPTCGWTQLEPLIPPECFSPPGPLVTLPQHSMGSQVKETPCPLCRTGKPCVHMAVTEDPKTKLGLLPKFLVNRVDGRDQSGGDREGADYFVLDLTFDPYAKAALEVYMDSCAAKYPALAADLRKKLETPEGEADD